MTWTLKIASQPHTVGLTGRILKVGSYPFNRSRHADIYEGNWIRDDDVAMSVSIAFTTLQTEISQFLCI
jgi:hypothetical protein